jgi:hypothetical protein
MSIAINGFVVLSKSKILVDPMVQVHGRPGIEMKEPRGAMIHIYPSSNEKFHECFCGKHLRDTSRPVLGHFFIKCDTWLQYVCERTDI